MDPSSHGGTSSLVGSTPSFDAEAALDAAVAEILHRSQGVTTHLAKLRLAQVLAERPAISVGTLIVCSLVMGDIYVSVSCAGLHWASSSSLIFHGTFVLALVSWERAVVEDPGRIPENWKLGSSGKPIFEEEGGLQFPKERGSPSRPYFCMKEEKFRPERAHFCKLLNRNVLRMDHYCVWLANCVGYRNHKYFYLAVLYSAVASTIGNAVLVQAFLHPSHLPITHRVILLPGTMLSFLLVSMLWPYLGFHTFLISRNLTTIEYMETRNVLRGFSRYDEGLYGNIQCVFGDFWPLWLLPISGPDGTGLEWGVARVAEVRPQGFLTFTKKSVVNIEHSSPSTAAASSSNEVLEQENGMRTTSWVSGSALALEVCAYDSWQSLSQTVEALANLCRPQRAEPS